MKNRVIDLPYIGKDTYNINILQLKNDKKLLKLYFQNIESFINSFDDNKKLLKKIIKELDKYSPMDHPFCFLKKFQIILNLQYLYFDNFLEKSHKSFEHLKESINSNLTMISQFLSNIQEISDNIKLNSDFMNKQNELILSSFEQTEKAIVEDYLKLNKRINKSKENKNKVSKEQLINECHKNENDYMELSKEINNKINEYKKQYNLNMKEIKLNMINLSQKATEDISNIIQINKDIFNDSILLLDNEMQKLKNYDINNKEFEPSISKYLKYNIEENELSDLIKPNKYKICIINNPVIQIEGTMVVVDSKEIYEIVKLIYSYEFNMIDENYYDLDIEKQKLDIIVKTGKLLGFDFYKSLKTNIEIFSEEEITNYINFLFSKEDYLYQCLLCLNRFRSAGNLEFTEEQFDIFKIIFDKACDYLLEHKHRNIYYYVIILSQTYYKMDKSEKYFLQNYIGNKEFFKQINFWTEFIEEMINEELTKFEKQSKNLDLSEEKKKEKIDNIIFCKIISLSPSLNNFKFQKEELNSILLPLINKYNMKDENKNNIYSMLDAFNK